MQVVTAQEYRTRFRGNAVVLSNGELAEPEEWDYEPEIPEEYLDWEEIERKRSELITISPSAFVEFAVKVPDKETQKYVSFSFDGRRYLRLPYDTPSHRTLYKCGRQVEKCVSVDAPILLPNNSTKPAGEVKVGDWVSSLHGTAFAMGRVSWVSERIWKPGVRIRTRQGHEALVATSHPMRIWEDWKEAGSLRVGDKIAVVRQAGMASAWEEQKERDRIILTAYMLGDGHIGEKYLNFTSLPGAKLDEFLDLLKKNDVEYIIYPKAKTSALNIRVNKASRLREWFSEDGLLGKLSHEKFLPNWVFELHYPSSALFLNRLWSTDGHVKRHSKSRYSIEYCSTSLALADGVRRMLWGFGIPTKLRTLKPKNGRVAYLLRVETQEGVRRFLKNIGALGKSESVEVPEAGSNNNRDTYPIQINDLVRHIIDSRGGAERLGCQAENSLRSAGLRETLKYPPTKEKLQLYVAFFRSDDRYDQKLVDELERHVSSGIYWDEIVSLEYTEKVIECVDFEVEDTHNFVVGGMVAHNSTLLGNKTLAYCCIINAFNVLYVAPTNQQTKVFSKDRLKEPVETSDVLRSWTTTQLSDNVFEKQFINRSKVTLRYAYHNADRVRGIPADMIEIDEIQDINIDNIPVIEECASHSPHKIFIYSGTPKTLDNPIEKYWNDFSTQNEWVVPCERHGLPSDPSTWHWNVLGEDHVGLKGLICDQCGEIIKPMHPKAQWASMRPTIRRPVEEGGLGPKAFEGFRIPQLMVPWITWDDLIAKRRTYSASRFHNEVLGLSYDSGTRPLTQQDLIENCRPGLFMSAAVLNSIKERIGATTQVFAGIDWGCHDEETRILTPRGFVHFRDLTDKDEVAQWDPDTREMSFTTPQVRTMKDWDQPLHHFEGKGLDMMLTHTHRMRVGVRSGKTRVWRTEPCERTVQRGGSVLFAGYVDWKGEERQSFILPGQPTSPGFQGVEPRTFSMDEWLEFLGYYLSEGGLCFDGERPSCLKMSQRETANPGKAKRIGDLLQKLFPDSLSVFPNPKTGDINWTIYGKQVWAWVLDNVGERGHWKRIPREFLSLSKRQLKILFDAMMLGDGSTDPRPGNDNGYYCSTSKGLCEDFQELCIRLGLRATLSLHKPEEENRKARWRVSWSTGRDFQYNDPKRTKIVPYKGKVYCCKVPTGYIVTERNGCIAYQGNTGEGSYTVLSLGAYLDGFFTIFYVHRFEGQELEPPIQMGLIEEILKGWGVECTGVDYGGGQIQNDQLMRKFGPGRIWKYQYSQPGQKVKWHADFKRFLVHRTEVMTDIFTAIKRKNVIRFPDWTVFKEPFGDDCLNIFSEYNEQTRQIEYKHAPGHTDDSFHSMLLCFLVSMLRIQRLDILNPSDKTGAVAEID